MYTYVWSYDIYKSFATQEEAYEAALKQISEHPTTHSKITVCEIKQVMKASVPVTIENVSLEDYKKDCECQGASVQALLSN